MAVRLLAAASMLGIAAILAPGVNAQETGSHISFTGAYLFNDSSGGAEFDKFGFPEPELIDVIKVDPGRNGWQGGVELGFHYNPKWDWRVAGNFVFLDTDKSDTEIQSASNDLDFQYFDVEFGYFPTDTNNVRLFAGLRVLNSQNDVSRDKLGLFGFDEHDRFSSDYLGIGPRAGLGAILPLGDSIFSLKANAAASVLFGDIKRTQEFGGKFGSFTETDSDWRTVFNAEGSAALNLRLSESASLDIGYRAQKWWDLIDDFRSDGSIGKGDVFVHGPFVTFTVALP